MQEYIQERIRKDPSNIKSIIEMPSECDLHSWLYEHVRQFLMEINVLVVELKDVCNQNTCQQMTVGNEKYRCTVHQVWQDCCAIQYILHNLDQSTEILLKTKRDFANPNLKE